MSDAPLATVVICTRDRAHILAATLTALLEVEEPAVAWEVLIVDNGSRDDTVARARELFRRASRPVRVVEHPHGGLSEARNAGIRHAAGDIVVFVDDDAFPRNGWLSSLTGALAQPGVLVAGGPVEPRFEGTLPVWFGERFLPYI